ncbi:hypothetical protein BKA65DRAFT_227013 [Rhexocercosporidium sp. MPI-PUGE-AT-0058]|nr:hypothetical protein BKA65DRAFT_227013 [Rhexocercosporidium sp. MPI-PUGE-AT-0058]
MFDFQLLQIAVFFHVLASLALPCGNTETRKPRACSQHPVRAVSGFFCKEKRHFCDIPANPTQPYLLPQLPGPLYTSTCYKPSSIPHICGLHLPPLLPRLDRSSKCFLDNSSLASITLSISDDNSPTHPDLEPFLHYTNSVCRLPTPSFPSDGSITTARSARIAFLLVPSRQQNLPTTPHWGPFLLIAHFQPTV